MNITIDGKELKFNQGDNNIVDLADRYGIRIPAPCYRSKKRNGCCKACLIEIDGNEAYACGTKPQDGMDVVFKREDLNVKRKDRLKEYAENSARGEDCNCDCDCC